MGEETIAAERIRALRLGQGLTLSEFGRRTNLTAGQLSRIENRLVNPPVATLAVIARALGTTLADLFREDIRHHPLVVSRRSAESFVPGGPGYAYCLPAGAKRDKLMETFLLRITRKSAGKGQKVFSHQGQEYMRVLRGKLAFAFEDQEHILEEGDSVYFDSIRMHRVRPAGGDSVDVLVVITSRDLLYNGDLQYLIRNGVCV